MPWSSKAARFSVGPPSTTSFDRPLLAATAICHCPSRSKRDPGLETAGNLANVGLKLWPKRREVEMSDNRHLTCADWVGCVFALILSLGALPANAGVLSTTDVLAKTGQSIDAWGAAWWQNAFVHPDLLGDTTGEFGYLGNVGGPVFFAEGSGGDPVSLSYTVPNNQYILLPVATYIWTFFDPCASVGCARTIVNSFVSGITDAFASIDGVPVADLTSHLVTVDTTTPFVFQVDAGPIGPDGYGGILDAVQGGLWLMLDPLSSGMHTLTFGAPFRPSIRPPATFSMDPSNWRQICSLRQCQSRPPLSCCVEAWHWHSACGGRVPRPPSSGRPLAYSHSGAPE